MIRCSPRSATMWPSFGLIVTSVSDERRVSTSPSEESQKDQGALIMTVVMARLYSEQLYMSRGNQHVNTAPSHLAVLVIPEHILRAYGLLQIPTQL